MGKKIWGGANAPPTTLLDSPRYSQFRWVVYNDKPLCLKYGNTSSELEEVKAELNN